MPDARLHQVTELLQAIDEGDEQAADRLLPLVYEELRKLAHHRMAREPAGQTLQPTALVHEAYLRLVGAEEPAWRSRGHFFGAAAEAMRRIMIDRARRHRLPKHGGGRRRVPVRPTDLPGPEEPVDLLLLDEALRGLEARDQRMSEVVKLRYFAGLTVEQTASALGVTGRTVDRDWTAAKAWLFREMSREGGGASP
jgi:RNA polymerase sigma factor (TIGR02999 family)